MIQSPFSGFIFGIAILQCFAIGVFLIAYKKDKTTSHRILAVYFFLLSLNLLDQFLYSAKIYFDYPRLAFWSGAFPLLFGPLLYLFVRTLTDPAFHLKPRWPHFMPFFILLFITEMAYQLQPAELKTKILEAIYDREVPWQFHLVTVLVLAQFIGYMLAAFRRIEWYKAQVSNRFSDFRKQNLTWLSRTLVFFTALMVLSSLNALMALTPYGNLYGLGLVGIVFLLFLFLTQSVFKALEQTEFYSFASKDELATKEVLGEQEISAVAEKLQNCMEKDQLFKNPELTLEELAGSLNLRPRLLTHVLNDYMDRNFFDYVNGYRVEEAKKLLVSSPDAKTFAVGMDAGFNSKSTFHALFKRYTGLTPGLYRKKHAFRAGIRNT